MRGTTHTLKKFIIVRTYLNVRLQSTCNFPHQIIHAKRASCPTELQATEIEKSPYYIEDGLRKVYPYYYKHSTFCKGRWINRKLIDVYSDEFALYPREEYEFRISKGILKVNDETVKQDYVLKNADRLSSIIHRHELTVLACPIKILCDSEHFLVVDKPPSIPVHPCGLYYQNSLVNILANEYNIHNLYVIHRLDRMTSGVVIFAKSVEKSREIHDQMNLRKINKEYVCRVEGNFPDRPITCNKPIKHLYNKVGVALIHPEGKVSVTEFRKISYNGKSSLVLCKPLTGRTHQIRVHLQYLGHPIINDPIYNSTIFGPEKGKSGIICKNINEVQKDLQDVLLGNWCLKRNKNNEISNFLNTSVFKMHFNVGTVLSKYKKDYNKIIFDEDCYFCKLSSHDPVQTSLGLFLHAFKYEGEGWKFEAEMPFWASKDWNIA